MSYRFAFLPLALSFCIAALAGPLIEGARPLVNALSEEHDIAQRALRDELGRHAIVNGPVLQVPVITSAETPPGAAPDVTLYPATLDIHVDQITRTDGYGGLPGTWHDHAVRITSGFEAIDDLDLLSPGERLDWDRAYLAWPMAAPNSFRAIPALQIGERPIWFERRTDTRGRVRYETGPIGLPTENVTMTNRISNAGSVLDIFPQGWETTITLDTDSLFSGLADVRPDRIIPGWPGHSFHWSIDGTASFGKAERMGVHPPKDAGFLGISITEPDGLGPATVYSDRTGYAYERYYSLVRLLPLAFAVAAIVLTAMGPQGVGVQLRLLVVFISGLLAAIYLAPRIGSEAAWYAGAAMAGFAAIAVFADLGWRRVTVLSLGVTALWAFHWTVPYLTGFNLPQPLGFYAENLAQPILVLLCLTALSAAGLQTLLRRRPAVRTA